MAEPNSQILTVAQMRAAEQALIDGGISVDALMQLAGQGAAEWVWRLAWPRPVTVLCGPGNNGGDGYVIAEALRRRGLEVAVVAPLEPKTEAARNARAAYQGLVSIAPDSRHGGTLVDCLFGSGLTRALPDDLFGMLHDLAAAHPHRVAIDLPSGIESDSGRPLNNGLPGFDLTIALGAWKFAHWLMPASAAMGARKLVPIGGDPVAGAANLVGRPVLSPPPVDSHKYRRGLLGVIGGAMPGAAILASCAAMHAGAGYVKLFAEVPGDVPPELVAEPHLPKDERIAAVLVGPGLGREDSAFARLTAAISLDKPLVVDGDGIALLAAIRIAGRNAPVVVTPHEGEFAALAGSMRLRTEGSKVDCTVNLAKASGLFVVAKGPDTVIAAPDGRVAVSPPASSWLSTAGTGDVLAGLIASRLAAGAEPFDAACEAVWLHGEAARLAGPAFAVPQLIDEISTAYSTCL